MTPDQKFARWIKHSIILFVLTFAYFLFADLAVPLTPQAMATRTVTQVAPQINGPVSKVYVHTNQPVKQGDVLFEIDTQPFELAVAEARLQLAQAFKNNDQLDASIAAAEAKVTASEIIAEQKVREANRLNTLFQRNGTSRQLRDDTLSAATAAKADLAAARASLKELKVNRGAEDDSNINIRVAKNKLEKALLNLSYTQVTARHDGVITNLQLEPGTYAAAGKPLVALVDTKLDIIADFREKSLRHFDQHSKALIAFDSQPGTVYSAEISSLDAGVSNGQFSADGNLATPTESNRWVRDAQRMRLHLTMQDTQAKPLPAGARATVQLVPDGTLLSWLAYAQIKFLSTLHYIY